MLGHWCSELGSSIFLLGHWCSELGTSTFLLGHWCSELGTSTFLLGHLCSELGSLTFLLGHWCSELETPSSEVRSHFFSERSPHTLHLNSGLPQAIAPQQPIDGYSHLS
ncbi:hypothetical protein [Nostoc sp. C110]|uniref:hypothetical protein n=1 Tax=Nostoc sp. C110 TaxID=3349876 RepID=UPI00370D067E